MPGVQPFDEHSDRYEDWFERNGFVYQSELDAVRKVLPGGFGIEIGSGSGRFAAPLGIRYGVDPSMKMNEIARSRGVEVVCGAAEALPVTDSVFDFVLMVTTVCFVDDIDLSFDEARRVLKPTGRLVVGFIDRNSPVGKSYEANKERSVFYSKARFYSTEEIVAAMEKAGFSGISFAQTIFRDLSEIKASEPVKEGYGEGSFVVVSGLKR